MTVNINPNAPSSHNHDEISKKPKSDNQLNKNAAKLAFNKLSSGVTLPEQVTSAPERDSSEVNGTNSSRNDRLNSNLSKMQEEVTRVESFQNIVEEVSQDIWSIEEQVTSSSAINENSNVAIEEKEQASQKIVDSRIANIDEKSQELLTYLSDFRDNFLTDIENINSKFLGRVEKEEDSLSLNSLGGDVKLSSPEAAEIVTKAEEDIASIQVSTEMYRSNILNEINDTLNMAISSIDTTKTNNDLPSSIDSSVEEIMNILTSNPGSFSGASGVDTAKVASLLL